MVGGWRRSSSRPLRPTWLALTGLWLLAGCGTPLLATSIPTTDDAVAEVCRGGASLGCHPLRSELFRLYLVCPEQDTVLGVMDSDGRLGFACPDKNPKHCRRFVAELRRRGGARAPEEGL